MLATFPLPENCQAVFSKLFVTLFKVAVTGVGGVSNFGFNNLKLHLPGLQLLPSLPSRMTAFRIDSSPRRACRAAIPPSGLRWGWEPDRTCSGYQRPVRLKILQPHQLLEVSPGQHSSSGAEMNQPGLTVSHFLAKFNQCLPRTSHEAFLKWSVGMIVLAS